jgi:hypothetical protein
MVSASKVWTAVAQNATASSTQMTAIVFILIVFWKADACPGCF